MGVFPTVEAAQGRGGLIPPSPGPLLVPGLRGSAPLGADPRRLLSDKFAQVSVVRRLSVAKPPHHVKVPVPAGVMTESWGKNFLLVCRGRDRLLLPEDVSLGEFDPQGTNSLIDETHSFSMARVGRRWGRTFLLTMSDLNVADEALKWAETAADPTTDPRRNRNGV